MMHPIATLADGTEMVYFDPTPDGRLKICFDRPDAGAGACHATVWVPGYDWGDVFGFTEDDIQRFRLALLEYAPRWIDKHDTGENQWSPEDRIDDWRARLSPEDRRLMLERLDAAEDWEHYERTVEEYRTKSFVYPMEEMDRGSFDI